MRSIVRTPHRRGTTGPLAAAVTAALVLVGCQAEDDPVVGNGGEETEEDGAVDDGAETIEIVDNDYSPADLEVAVGTTVDFEHVGDVTHTVTFDDGEDSGDLEAGESYSRTFDEAGEFDYVCTIHPAMQATVTVTE